ncbi:metal ABC transporter ATP-binding protein [Heyndrickxia camelliae]|uniref:Zinc ABC transporter ATP-binding protein n=1 Tax=Heyndrickxia camelliae TaxID=1707093 RepID=A0A2N3LHU8_9BACI|nr:metal ABC transporter ATP-binding protein [Heyndrickxia camelliae]PKR84212.1 zinc ABC transporter ATP-binding protein [Heyndrickxia camelliae]
MKLAALENVTFGYTHIPTLNSVSFEIASGEFVGVTGANGASKSTILKLMLGLIKPWSGRIYLSKTNSMGNPLKVGYVPQQIASFNVGFPSSVIELVRSGRFQDKKWYQRLTKLDHEIVENALNMVGMWEFKNEKIGSLSGGQKQKICIARVLATEPDLLVLDEPTTGMDYDSRVSFYKFMKHQVRLHKRTVVMVTHDQEEAGDSFDKMIHLEKGEHGEWKCLTLSSCNGHFGQADSLQLSLL